MSDESQSNEAEANEAESSQSKPNESQKIKLDQFLKSRNLVSSGGEAKMLIQDGQVQVNGEVETRRGRKLVPGDIVSLGGETLRL